MLKATIPAGLANSLLCFALIHETRYLPAALKASGRVIVTGIGYERAKQSIEHALEEHRPGFVITAGFAAGLNPAVKVGDVIFDADPELVGVSELLQGLGARPGTIHCHIGRIHVTGGEKKALWLKTGADASEMESEAIRKMCREWSVPSITIRAISDINGFPVDFNTTLNRHGGIHYGKLAVRIAARPRAVPGLIRLGRDSMVAAQRLGEVLGGLFARV